MSPSASSFSSIVKVNVFWLVDADGLTALGFAVIPLRFSLPTFIRPIRICNEKLIIWSPQPNSWAFASRAARYADRTGSQAFPTWDRMDDCLNCRTLSSSYMIESELITVVKATWALAIRWTSEKMRTGETNGASKYVAEDLWEHHSYTHSYIRRLYPFENFRM